MGKCKIEYNNFCITNIDQKFISEVSKHTTKTCSNNEPSPDQGGSNELWTYQKIVMK